MGGRSFVDFADLNAQARHWLTHTANVRIHATTKQRPIDLWPQEGLTSVTSIASYRVYEITSRKAGFDGFVRFAGSRYSLPPQYAGQTVIVFGMGNSAVLTPLLELTIAIGPNQTWYFDYTLIVVSTSTPPAGIVSIAYGGTGRPTPANDSAAVGGVGPIYMGGTSNLSGLLQRISGTVVNGATSGSLVMQVAQKTADGNSLQVFPGSSVVAFRIS